MRRLTSRTAAALAVCLGIVVPAGAAFGDTSTTPPAPSGQATAVVVDNSAVSVNTADHSSVFHLAFTIVRSSGPSVSVSNVALAVTACTNCRAIAVAIQVDLVWPVPAVLNAENLSVAVASGCTTCDALAAAFQYVVASPQPMQLTRQGRHDVAAIEHQLRALESSGLAPADLVARVDALAAQLGNVLATELVPAHHAERGDDHGVPAAGGDGWRADD